MIFSVATTTWNSADLIGIFLQHYRRLGFDRALVMDFDSTDGTRDVLTSAEWRSFVELIPFPGIALLDSSDLMLSRVRQGRRPESSCLFCDPDELLVTPSMSIRDPALVECAASSESVSIPRFNVTALRSVAVHDPGRLTALDSLTLKIERRCTRTQDDFSRETLEPPWIFTNILSKVLVRASRAIAIGEGDHSARTANGEQRAAPDGVFLLHYPFRQYLVI